MLDKQLQSLAEDWAEKVVHDICLFLSEGKKLTGDSLVFYDNLNEWKWFEHSPLNSERGEISTRLFLSMNKYAKLKWAKEHPPKQKRSKWEMVVGKVKKK